MNFLQKRIHYQGNLKILLQQVCRDFAVGKYCFHRIISIGYEDFNLVMTTDQGEYFVKIFGSFRDYQECQRYVDIIKHVVKAGISHPSLNKSTQGFLYQISVKDLPDRLCVMEYIDGKNFYELQDHPTQEEMRCIIKQAALINAIPIKPSPVYDHWAVTSFLQEYEEKKQYLSKEDNKILYPLIEIFQSLSLEKLPHCFVHGDITKTNTMRSTKGDIYILDFAVANGFVA